MDKKLLTLLGAGAAGGVVGYLLGKRSTAPAGALYPAGDPRDFDMFLQPKTYDPYGNPDTIARAVAATPVTTVDQLLATCPTSTELATFARDGLRIYGQAIGSVDCRPNAIQNNYPLLAVNMMRLARLITFDAPIPLLGTANLYELIRSRGYRINFLPNSRGDWETPVRNGGQIYMTPGDGWDDDIFRTFFYGPQKGMALVLARLVHVLRHAMGGPRHIPTGVVAPPKGSFGYAYIEDVDRPDAYGSGGSWEAEIQFYNALANNSGGYLNAQQKQTALEAQQIVAQSMIRDYPSITVSTPGLGEKNGGFWRTKG